MKKETVGTIEMLICAALWSIAGIFMKLLPWNGFAVAGLRSLIAGLTMAAAERWASLPPRRTQALPAFRHRAAASEVTLGRDS